MATDAGHGVNGDPGTVDGKSYEKDYALLVKERINFFPGMFAIDNTGTRTGDAKHSDRFIWRYGIANDHEAELFVSIHLNGGTKEDNIYDVYQQEKSNESESKELVPQMVGNLSDVMKTNFNSVSIVKQRTRFDNLAVLNGFKGKAGVLLELGSNLEFCEQGKFGNKRSHNWISHRCSYVHKLDRKKGISLGNNALESID
jgi:N-acetylmuramoyl-L-alanine amidase